MKKICIYGLGAIGGLLAVKMALAGYQVSAVARGATREAVSNRGLQLCSAAGDVSAMITVDADPKALGPQDLVILSVKSTGLGSVAREIVPLIGPNTTVLSAMNGIPWWFTMGLNQQAQGLDLSRLDPKGEIGSSIPSHLVLGCVTHLSATTQGPGQINHISGNRLIIGEPLGEVNSVRVKALHKVLIDAGFETDIAPSIQHEIWFKLWGNMTMNPVSFITSCTGDIILSDRYIRDFLSRCMLEAAAVGEHIGLPIHATPEDRHQVTEKLGAFKTSMLQDLESMKPIELDGILAIVVDMAQQLRLPSHNLETLYGLTRAKASQLKLY